MGKKGEKDGEENKAEKEVGAFFLNINMEQLSAVFKSVLSMSP